MILQYKGYNENWVFTEADEIAWANVYVGDVIKEALCRTHKGPTEAVADIHNVVVGKIAAETHSGEDGIVFHIGEKQIKELTNVCAVLLFGGRSRGETYVFDSQTAYILNNNGKTIQRVN
jgi:thymidine phosphorylase